MTNIHKLHNQIKHYKWGSPVLLPQFLGLNNSNKEPYAEMWMGTNKSAPSSVEINGEITELNSAFGEVPFLFKLLAVEEPLSIQAHPNREQAIEGFSGGNINYSDANKKDEILCALTPFTLMAGFRQTDDVFSSYKNASNEQLDLIKYFESLYPNDSGVYSPLFLNLITLQPGQAVFIPACVPHSYISGFGLELMNSSDNVLRGGLTSKHIDIIELNKIINPEPFLPQIINPLFADTNVKRFDYPSLSCDFSLSVINSTNNAELTFSNKGCVICIVTEGQLTIGDLQFKKGDSFFIPGQSEAVLFKGDYSLYAAIEGVTL